MNCPAELFIHSLECYFGVYSLLRNSGNIHRRLEYRRLVDLHHCARIASEWKKITFWAPIQYKDDILLVSEIPLWISRPSYLHNGISYTGKMTSLYWIRAQVCGSTASIYNRKSYNDEINYHKNWARIYMILRSTKCTVIAQSLWGV